VYEFESGYISPDLSLSFLIKMGGGVTLILFQLLIDTFKAWDLGFDRGNDIQ
jgi:hypothetical protein